MAKKLKKQDMYYLIDRQGDYVVVLNSGTHSDMEKEKDNLLFLADVEKNRLESEGRYDLVARFQLNLDVWPDQLNLFTNNIID